MAAHDAAHATAYSAAHSAAEVRLINKVVVHFGYLPANRAATEVADHVRKFWEPRMRQRLLDLVDAGSAALDPVAVAAAAMLR